jgi:hypothetical protein
MTFGILPERVHFLDGGLLRSFACGGQPSFDVAEAAAEFGVGFAQRLLGIHLQQAREIDDDEEQVAELAFDLSRVASVALFRLDRRVLRAVWPTCFSQSKPTPAALDGDLLRFDQRRQ